MVQRDIPVIIANTTAAIPDNTTELVSPADVRTAILDTLDSLMARGTETFTQNRFVVVGSDGQTLAEASMEEMAEALAFNKSCVFLPSEIRIGDAGIRFADPVVSFHSDRTNRDFLAVGVPYTLAGSGDPMQVSLAASEEMPATAQQTATDTTLALSAGDTFDFVQTGGAGVDHILSSFITRVSVAGTVNIKLFVGANDTGANVLNMDYDATTSDTAFPVNSLARYVDGQSYFVRITAVTDVTLVGTGAGSNFRPYSISSGWPYGEIRGLNENNVVGILEEKTGDDRLDASAIKNLPASGASTAAEVSVSSAAFTGILNTASNVQVALNRLDATGLGADPREFTGSFFASYGELGNQDVWYGGRQTVSLIGARGQPNGLRTFELPDPTELNLMFDDLEARGLGQVYTLTVGYLGGSTTSVIRNALTIRAPSVSALFDRNEIPVTIAQGAEVTFRIRRVSGTLSPWERVSVQAATDPVATFGEVVLQNTGWNNSDNSFLPSGAEVQKGYAFPVIGSNPNDGTLRQGLIDGGVSARPIYDGDYVVWTADAFTAWTDGDNWFVLSRNDMQRISAEAVNFLSQVSEIDNRVDVGFVQGMAGDALVWLSENPFTTAPFLTPSTDPSNPRSGDDYAYVGGRENRNGMQLFQFGQNRFNSYITLGITPSFITAHPESTIDIVVMDGSDFSEIERLNLANDFVFRDDGDFTNGTVRHYTRASTFNYPFLAIVAVVLTQTQQHFRINPATTDVTPNIPQGGVTEQLLSSDVQEKLNRALPTPGTDFSSIEERISPYKQVSNTSPAGDALFFDAAPGDAYPSDLSSFTQVSEANPRHQANNTVLFVAVREPGNFALENTTADTIIALDNSEPTVEVVESLSDGGVTYFVYRVTSIISGNRYEVSRVTNERVVAWPDDINNLEDDIARIDAELEHAALNLPDAVVQVLDNEFSVIEESTPTVVATDYNNQLAGPSNATQTVFYETSPNAPGGGVKTSKPISDTSGTDRARRKLLYIPGGTSFVNQAYVSAFDGVTGRDLIRYDNGTFNARVRVPAIPASTTTNTVYPAQATRISGAGIWQTVPALTFVNGVPVPEADEIFFTRNIPTSAVTLTIQYRGHANGNSFGASSTMLANVGGGTDAITTFTLNDGSEQVDVEIRYTASTRQIRVSETSRVFQGLPTINDIEVILSYDETRTVPATGASTRNVPIEFEHPGGQVFAFKPSSADTLIIVGDQTEIDTGWAYTTLFGAGEGGHLLTPALTAEFLDYEDFEPIASTVTDLENHATLPQFGLFTTQYTRETILDVGVTIRPVGLNVGNLPTAATGLVSGDLWNNAGTLTIVP